MRKFGVVALGAVVSWLVGMGAIGTAILLGFVAQPGPHMEFWVIATTAGMAVVAVGTAVVFLIVLAVGGKRKAIRRTAIAMVILLLLIFAAPIIFGAMMTDTTDVIEETAFVATATSLAIVAVSALAVVLMQWWAIKRYLDFGRVL